MSFTTLSDFKNLYASKPLFVFDTNVYLNLLRYSKAASLEILNLLKAISSDIYVPNQVKAEFEKNLSIVSNQRINDIKSASKEIKLKIESCNQDVHRQLDLLIRRKFDGSQEVANKVAVDFQKIKSDINDYISNSVLSNNENFLVVDEISEFLDSLYTSEDSPSYTQSELLEIYKEGHFRYKYKIPPGYMDDPNNNKNSSKQGAEIFGDLILWNQVLDIAHNKRRAVVFVTADSKEDWFILRNKQPIEPCNELIKEFDEKTEGFPICILTHNLLVEYLGNTLAIDIDFALLEMQVDDFIDITVRNKQSDIFDNLINWANKDENILQFPFVDEVNRLESVSNPRLVVQNASLEVNGDVKYTAVLRGTADFVGVYYDKSIKRYKQPKQQATFLYDIRISLVRNLEDTESGRKVAKEVSCINIDGAVFEAISTGNLPLESKRGVFIVPNEDDHSIYNYMKSVWDEYESNHSVDVAEALVFFDAANHFNCSLLDINRAFSLVQNQQSKLNLSLNEIDALALKRFSDIRIVINGNNASFMEKTASLGDAYPTPESMIILPPEVNKEIDVEFSCQIERPDNKYVQIKGLTNLPPSTHLMLTIFNNDNSYRAQSKTDVQENGDFLSEIFSNAKGGESNSLLPGSYTLEIVVPIFGVQPDSVKAKMGKKGRNLIGQLVSVDSVLGKTIRYAHNFTIT